MAAARVVNKQPVESHGNIRMCVITWNIANKEVTFLEVETLLDHAFRGAQYSLQDTDMLVIGLQETPSPVSSVVGIDPVCTVFATEVARFDYVLLTSHRMSIMPGYWGLLSMVFVKRALLCYFMDLKMAGIRTGVGGLVGNKGASIVKVMVGDLDMCFVNCHLHAQEERNDKRLQDLQYISTEPCFDGESVMGSDVVLLYGDLNFRLQGLSFQEVVGKVRAGQLKDLLDRDQLQVDQVKGSPSGSNLKNFLEAAIAFPPSYKFQPNTSEYSDGGKGRVPSWCDRVLWSINPRLFDSPLSPGLRIANQSYQLCPEPTTSDHRAVTSHFTLVTDLGVPPPVIFEATQWQRGQLAEIAFEVAANTDVSSWDWIGLYPRGFSSILKDYVFWTYTPCKYRHNKATFHRVGVQPSSVPSLAGDFILAYYSKNRSSVLGMSPAFKIR